MVNIFLQASIVFFSSLIGLSSKIELISENFKCTKLNEAPVNTIDAPTFTGTAFCPGDALILNFTASGSYSFGNIFTAELSSSSGSFAAPITIGQVLSQSPAPIEALIPLGTAAGNGYRIRIVSNNPNTIGIDNGADITIAAGPIAGTASSGADTVCSGNSTTVTLTGGSGTAVWEHSNDGVNFSGSSCIGNSFNTSILSQSIYLRAIVLNSCATDTSNVILINVIPSPQAIFSFTQSDNSLDVTFNNNSTGTFSSADWSFGDGNSSISTDTTVINTYSAAGSFFVSLTVTNDFGCNSTFTDSIDIFPAVLNVLEDFDNFKVFPNPNSGSFSLEINLNYSQDLEINIIDLNGRVISNIYKGYLNSGSNIRQVETELNSGVYFLEIISDQDKHIKKLIVR